MKYVAAMLTLRILNLRQLFGAHDTFHDDYAEWMCFRNSLRIAYLKFANAKQSRTH